MSKTQFQTVQGVKIYPLDYLMNEELTESDLNCLFDTNSFIYSIIIGMYKFIKSKRQPIDIIKNIKKDNVWLSKNRWTIEERNKFELKLTKALQNIYSYSENIALQKAQWYMNIYGFDLK